MNKITKISLISLMSVCCFNTQVFARVNVKSNNRSYADAYGQVAALRYQQEYADSLTATTASTTNGLPVAVDDENLANKILNNLSTDVTKSDLEKCAMIYPDGIFRWGIPESGVRRTPVSQCISVVELRNANTKEVLATTTVASGDTMKCNVDSFPESGYSFNLKYGKVEVPADTAPTMEDVEAVMNQEQKQNAGFKIAAAALIGGVAANILAPKAPDDDKLLGTSATQLQDTAIGVAAGAGVMAASTYSGKVAGDTIKSTAVNAAVGMVAGNMAAGMNGSDSIITTTKCQIPGYGERDCVPGIVVYSSSSGDDFANWKEEQNLYHANNDEKCKTAAKAGPKATVFIASNGSSVFICNDSMECCNQVANKLSEIYVQGFKQEDKNTKIDKRFKDIKSGDLIYMDKYYFPADQNPKGNHTIQQYNVDEAKDKTITAFYLITKASYSSKKNSAFAVFDKIKTNMFGYNKWEDLLKEATPKEPQYYIRHNNGEVGDVISYDKEKEKISFEPLTNTSEDGNLVDLSNQARTKATLVGTATGGALGGMSGYQGAKDEISQRWTAAVRAYNDSLTNFACTTGGRFLASYNSYLNIPEIKEDEE